LFFEVARILRDKRPPAFLLENVRNLKNHDQGRTFRVIMRTLEDDLRYTVVPYVIDASTLLPQHRERVYIIGFRDRTTFTFPPFGPRTKTLQDVLEKEPDARYNLTEHLWRYLQDYAAKHREKGNGFGYGLVDRENPRAVTRTLSARYYKDGSEILIPTGNGTPRRLTPRDCARLMGFPESFEIPVSDTQAYKQFGNSVAVPVVAQIAKAIVACLGGDANGLHSYSGRPRQARMPNERRRSRSVSSSGDANTSKRTRGASKVATGSP
jgi:DNA (cytosine-5)-methyltransferase 1